MRGLAPDDGQRHRSPGWELGRQPSDVGAGGHASALELRKAIPYLEAGRGRWTLLQHNLDGHTAGGIRQIEAEETAWPHLRIGLFAEQGPHHLHQTADRIHPASVRLALKSQRRRRRVVQAGPDHLGLGKVELQAVARQNGIANDPMQFGSRQA